MMTFRRGIMHFNWKGYHGAMDGNGHDRVEVVDSRL